jgi:hypothetical protein
MNGGQQSTWAVTWVVQNNGWRKEEMKRQTNMKGLFYISLLLWLVLGGSCSEADAPEKDANETDGLTPVTFTLSTKAGEGTTEDEKTLNDLTVLQFDGTGDEATCITSRYLLSPVPEGGTGNTYSIGLRMAESGGYIVLIANAGPQFRSYEEANKTLSDFKNETLTLNQQTANEKNVLMIGSATLAAPGGNTSETAVVEGAANVIEIQLKRLVARIRFTWKLVPTVTNTTFEPLSLKLRSVPKVLRYIEETTLEKYPASSTDNFKDYTAIVDAIDKGYTWYIPMNRRGKGEGVVNVWDKTAEHAPDEFCTFIELSGIFRTPNMPDQLATYRFYVGGDNRAAVADGSIDYNDYNVEANGDYSIEATIVGINTFDKRVEKKNFIYQEPANCYLVAPEAGAELLFSPYKDPGTDVAGSGIVYKDLVVEDRYSKISGVRTVWQTSADLITVLIGQGMINVIPNDKGISGNALIAAYDESNQILWSWHIWVTPYAAIVNDNVTNPLIGILHSYGGQVWMDRNLGALDILRNAFPELVYQWGRKDPFRINSASSVPGDKNTAPLDPIISSVKNPDVFYTSSAAWYGNSGLAADLWQERVKTIFDPCPYGWQVPPDGSWNDFVQNETFFTWYIDRFSEYKVDENVKAIYPLGDKLNNSTGNLNNPSDRTYGYLWSSTCPVGSNDAYSFGYVRDMPASGTNTSAGRVYPHYLQCQSSGVPVRCVKIK